MKLSKKISLWKKRSEIDYIPLFLSLWVAFNVWMKSRWGRKTRKDRDLINFTKGMDNGSLKKEFIDFILGKHSEALTFKGYFVDLHKALEKASIDYDPLPSNLKDTINKKISFSNCIINWNDGTPELETILRRKRQHNIIEISSNFRVEGNNDRLFAAYIEILYQVRCLLVHGNLPPDKKNERVIKYLYLTLSMIMKNE